MKQSDEPIIGGARKTLPTRRARKIPRANDSPALKRSTRKKNLPHQELGQDWVKIFGEK